jgi:general secretion pathway protein G
MRRSRPFIMLVALILAAMCGWHIRQLRHEASLRETLLLLRTEIGQFTRDHQRPPSSLSELVSGGYMKRFPADPITGKNDTWQVEKSSNYFDVRSGSAAMSSAGTRYNCW